MGNVKHFGMAWHRTTKVEGMVLRMLLLLLLSRLWDENREPSCRCCVLSAAGASEVGGEVSLVKSKRSRSQ